MAANKPTDKIAKAKQLAKDVKTTKLAVPTGNKLYIDGDSAGYKALDKAGKIKKKITSPGGKNDAFSSGTQTYRKSELAAAERLVARKEKPTKTAITVKGSQIANDRSKTAMRAALIASRKKKEAEVAKKKGK